MDKDLHMKHQRPPGPSGHPIFGNMLDFGKDPLTFLRQLPPKYGDTTFLRFLNQHFYVLSNPNDIREVLVSQADKFEKSELDRKILGKFLGNGLLTSEGNFHARQRRLAQPAFHSKRIRAYADVMVDYSNHLIAEWEDGQQRDIADEMMRLTMYIVSKTLFNADAITTDSTTAVGVGQAIHQLQASSNADYRRGFSLPDWFPTQTVQQRKKAVQFYDQTIQTIIDQRQQMNPDGPPPDLGDLLSMLMLSQDEDGSYMNNKQLRDEVATLFVAGHETTANTLSWIWYLLSQHPTIEARLHSELDQQLHGRTPTLEDLPKLPYSLQIIKESLRLYPPAWILNGRTALTDVQISRYTIPKGTIVFISPYLMHRLAHFFPNPDQFDPDRWTSDMEKELPKYAYIPFGGGPRVCIGNAFAMMEAHLLLATIAQQYRLHLSPGTAVNPNSQITLSPEDGLPMTIEKRTPNTPQPSRQPEGELAFA